MSAFRWPSGMDATLRAAILVDERRIQAGILGIDYDALLDRLSTLSRETPYPWRDLFDRLWDEALLEATS